MSTELDTFSGNIERCMIRDRHRLRRRLREIEETARDGASVKDAVRKAAADIERSQRQFEHRHKHLPSPKYPPELPVVEKRQRIADAIAANQVVILCGETGSGKTTQLPKICLELGRGVAGMIGHTQPRRIAARSVAMRIAQELDSPLGHAVGYKVRFSDKLSENTYIKLMTDGILLAETQHDRFLNHYDTLIIDEAHERSLNIDFLLGYLKQLLPKRRDLKVIITSATIDPQRFSAHFWNAPIIEVSGRTYPVEVRYRPLHSDDPDEEDAELDEAILGAVDELWREGAGDTLIFLSGEREIREMSEALRKHHPPGVEILPLYARLSTEEQMKVFRPHGKPRVVLATNVAETSLTVPGIRYVIDPGFARISRYAPRTKVQRLPIEQISQASANQRAGRCGRVGPGVCIRLYSEDDFVRRAQFMEPEILRTNLASVILQMKALRLGEVQNFPFIEPPDYRLIKDGYQTLHELGAINDKNELTEIGRMLAKLPIDPRIGRMILAGDRENCIDEMLIIASALSLQDPRERPLEKAPQADAAHEQFRDENSDFLGYLKLWDFWHQQAKKLSKNQMRKLAQTNFLSYVRMREWHDIHQQLHQLIAENGLVSQHAKPRASRHPEQSEGSPKPETRSLPEILRSAQDDKAREKRHPKFDQIHRALLTGLLGNIAEKTDAHEYTGARNMKLFLFPGSGLFNIKPPWVAAAELVETTRLYARTVARIQPEWIEHLAAHLVNRSYSDPHWQAKTGRVMAYERVSLYGLPIVARRLVHFGPIDPLASREMFIHRALIEGEFNTNAKFFKHNHKLVEEVHELEAKQRRRDLLVDAKVLYDFYDARIPAKVYSGPLFEAWRKEAERKDPNLLFMKIEDLMLHPAVTVTQDLFPDELRVNEMKLPLEYHLDPGGPMDGVTVRIPLTALNQIPPEPFEWVVPGLLEEKVLTLIRSLPKPLRVNFMPAGDTARDAARSMPFRVGSLLQSLAQWLGKRAGVVIRESDFDLSTLPDYLRTNFAVIDEFGNTVGTGRDLRKLREEVGAAASETFALSPESEFTIDEITSWDFGDLPERVEIRRHGMTLYGYPAIVDQGNVVGIRLLDSPEAADAEMRRGLKRLFMLQLKKEFTQLARSIPNMQQMCLWWSTRGSCDELKEDLLNAIADSAFFGEKRVIRTREAFIELANEGWRHLSEASRAISAVVQQTLANLHEVEKQLGGRLPPTWSNAAVDIRAQLSNLVYPGFISQTPPLWLKHLPRFVAGTMVRLQKLANAGLARDEAAMATIGALWKQYSERLEKHRKARIVDPAIEQYRWMLEELRVSLFAQELKTSVPVS
ncbi:MAG TPA: ATP-dependent RNA helicase HrpA, partial [Tepidisphaeraceae bacterium]|nr:ATP-dependent RNA helicase HrpA [Tepidisphaeraceae bacterium]